MSHSAKKIIVADTSVLINFLKIDRMDLIASHPADFFITEHVLSEVTADFSEQRLLLKIAIEKEILKVVTVNSEIELDIFNKLMKLGRLGVGECSAIAYAINSSSVLAMDDKQAYKQARKINGGLEIIGTSGVLKDLVENRIISKQEVDLIVKNWNLNHRFYCLMS